VSDGTEEKEKEAGAKPGIIAFAKIARCEELN
jgi:hypothetical protein